MRMRKKDRDKLCENRKFNTYKQWKAYIRNKCTDYSDDKLKEISRYLNQRLRNTKPAREYWSVLSPILLTVMFTQMPDIIKEVSSADLSGLPLLAKVIYVVLVGVLMFPVFGCIWSMMKPIWDNNVDEHFFTDYKAIIDELLKERG